MRKNFIFSSLLLPLSLFASDMDESHFIVGERSDVAEEAHKGIVKDKGLHAQETALFNQLKSALEANQPVREVLLAMADDPAAATVLDRFHQSLRFFDLGDSDRRDLERLQAGVARVSAEIE